MFYRLTIALALCFLFMGCRSRPNIYVLSLHEFTSRSITSGLVVQIKDQDYDHERSVQRFPFLNSASFPRGEVYGPDKRGRYGIRLEVERYSLQNFHTVATARYGQYFAVVVDGAYVGCSRFTADMRTGNICTIEPIWNNRFEAQQIVDNLAYNFDTNNPWTKR